MDTLITVLVLLVLPSPRLGTNVLYVIGLARSWFHDDGGGGDDDHDHDDDDHCDYTVNDNILMAETSVS